MELLRHALAVGVSITTSTNTHTSKGSPDFSSISFSVLFFTLMTSSSFSPVVFESAAISHSMAGVGLILRHRSRWLQHQQRYERDEHE